MTVKDDRAEFEANRAAQSVAMGRDKALLRQSTDVLTAADAYDYSYLWHWWGLPIIQLPADVMATQEVVFATRPDVVIETGVARGGSVVFLASLLQLLDNGKVVGVDIDIRAHNRAAIEAHPMSTRIVMVEGGSTDPETLDRVRAEIPDGANVMVVLDSDHSRDHVLSELRAYAPLVTPGQYLVVADTTLGLLEPGEAPTKRAQVLPPGDEPLSALKTYLRETDRFAPDPELNGKLILSSSTGGYLRCTA